MVSLAVDSKRALSLQTHGVTLKWMWLDFIGNKRRRKSKVPCSGDLSIYNLQHMMHCWSERFEKKLLGISAPLSSHHKIYLCAQFSMYVDNLNVVLQYGALLAKVREFCSTIAAPSINNYT